MLKSSIIEIIWINANVTVCLLFLFILGSDYETSTGSLSEAKNLHFGS